MADRRQLSEGEVDELLLQVAAVADLGRASGLELAGGIAAARADQAELEAARLRFRRGRDAPEAAIALSAAKARGERGTAASAAGEKVRKEIGELLKKRGDLEPKPPRAAAFTITGRVTEGRSGVPGLAIEARTSNPVKTAARGASGEKGEFELSIADVDQVKRELERPGDEPLMLTLVALKERRIVARSDPPFEAKAGASVTVRLTIGV